MKKLLFALFGLFVVMPVFAATLPAGYTEVEYIQGDGKAWIDTGLVPTTNTNFEIQLEYTDLSDTQGVIGYLSNNVPTTNFYVAKSSNANKLLFASGTGAQNITNITVSANTVYTYKLNGNVLSIDDSNINIQRGTLDATNTTMFIMNRGGSSNGLKGKVYYVKIWNGDTLVLDLVPVKKTVNGTDVYGMYNVLDSNPETAFYGNKGSGEFIGGDPVAQTPTNSGPISSVTVSGLVAQNGTPTPNTPVAINTNNGVLKAGNIYNFATNSALFNANNGYGWYINRTSSYLGLGSSANNTTWAIPCKPNTDYTISYVKGNINNEILRLGWITSPDLSFVNTDTSQPCTYVLGVDDGTRFTATIKTGSQATYIIVQVGSASYYQGDIRSALNLVIGNAISSIYTDGTQETITDSANHTANVATLLGVGDYHDTQNINTGAITRNVGVKVLDGTENWTQTSSYSGPWVFFTNFDDGKKGAGTLEKVWSTHFQGVNVTNPEMPPESAKITVQSTTPNISRFYLKTSVASTPETLSAWLADQYNAGTPVIVLYPLATETTESVAGQTMTMAPVSNKTGGVNGMTITTLLSSGASVVTTIADLIKIATTKYNNAAFSGVVTALSNAVDTIKTVVANTINQATAVANLQSGKQTMPNSTATNGTCPNYKQCLLVEDESGTPHWYVITDPFRDFVAPIVANSVNGWDYIGHAGYTQVEYIESTGTQYIDTGIKPTAQTSVSIKANLLSLTNGPSFFGSLGTSGVGGVLIGTDSSGTGAFYVNATSNPVSGVIIEANKVYEISVGGTTVSIQKEGEAAQIIDNTVAVAANNNNIYMIGRNNNGTAQRFGSFRYYYMKIYQNSNLVRDLVPVRRNSDGKYGMYDLAATNPALAFYPNAATTGVDFTAGNPVANPNPALPTTPTWTVVWAPDSDYAGSVNGTAKCNNSSSDATSTTSGSNCWCRVTSILVDGTTTNVDGTWAFRTGSGWTDSCVAECATSCAAGVYNNATFRRTVFGM